MNLIRQILYRNKDISRKRLEKHVKLNNLNEALSINEVTRSAPASIVKFALRGVDKEYIDICDTKCTKLTVNTNKKYFANTKRQKDVVVFYIHGGGFCTGFPEQASYLLKALMRYFGCDCIAPKYPLSPENIYPTAIDTLYNIYTQIQNTYKNIILIGESAGANLAVALMLKLRDNSKKQPACAILPSGFYDLTREGFATKENEKLDPSLSNIVLKYMGIAYTHGKNISDINKELLQNPYVSTIYACLKDLPPMFFSVCKDEILYDDTLKMVENCQRDNVSYQLHETKNCFHAYAIMGEFFTESKKSTISIVKFIKEKTPIKPTFSK